ncbi:hypothetical protein [Freshwater macrophyte associated tombus-like virus 2]|nr:hypothetical protein [Freshwater macrophyte associated tombus-like virus 2]
MELVTGVVCVLLIMVWLSPLVGVLAWWWCKRGTWGRQVVADMDEYVANERQPRTVPRWSMDAAIAAKAKFGELRYSNANRLIVDGFVRKWLKEEEPDMRNLDIVRFTPIAVELALTPTLMAVAAQQYSADRHVMARRGAVNHPK